MSEKLITPPAKAAKKAPAKKVAAKKAAAAKAAPAVKVAVAKKAPAKKAAKKVAAAAPAPVVVIPPPAPAPVSVPAAPAKKAAKKAVSKAASKVADAPVAAAPAPKPIIVEPVLARAVEEPAGVSALISPRKPRKAAPKSAPQEAAATQTEFALPIQPPPQAAPVAEHAAPAPTHQPDAPSAPSGNEESQEKPRFRRDDRPPFQPRNVRLDGQNQQPQQPAPGGPPPQGNPGNPQADQQGQPGQQGDRKNFRKSWKQRKFEKYLKRKQEREERLREQGIDPATVVRPQQNQQPRPPHQQQDRERPSERDWEMERDRRPDPTAGPAEPTAGILEISPKGFGFIRLKEKNFAQSVTDTFVTPEMVRKYGLRDGVWMEGDFRKGHRGPQLTELKTVNGLPPDHYRQLPIFEELTAINPNKRYVLETEETKFTTRLVDMIAPIGRGQRGLIVAAPRAGKTTFLEHMALAVLKNYPTTKLLILLVDERPEEVTELSRALPGAEIMASSNDRDPREHIRMAQLAIERAKRLVEAGEHVFMLMDSITRLARAFNQAIRGGGKAMSGGIDSRALEMPRKIFAAARNTREAGSLTIIATALIETNNKGDDLIFQEFKGTGNMELVLDRKIAQQYIYPAVDIFKSGTRREELLLPPYQLEKINIIRRGLAGHKPVEAVERLIHFLNRFKNNNELLSNIGTKHG